MLAKVTVQSVMVLVLLTAASGMITYLLYRHGKMKASTAILLPVLVFYLAFVATITLINRTPRRRYRYNLRVFLTIRAI